MDLRVRALVNICMETWLNEPRTTQSDITHPFRAIYPDNGLDIFDGTYLYR